MKYLEEGLKQQKKTKWSSVIRYYVAISKAFATVIHYRSDKKLKKHSGKQERYFIEINIINTRKIQKLSYDIKLSYSVIWLI